MSLKKSKKVGKNLEDRIRNNRKGGMKVFDRIWRNIKQRIGKNHKGSEGITKDQKESEEI